MKTKPNALMLLIFVLTMFSLLSACTPTENESVPNGESEEPEEERHEPVTLKINLTWDDDKFEKYWVNPVQEKYPWITLQKIHAEEIGIEEQLAQGNVPDLITARNHEHVSFLDQRELTMDMTELIEKHQFDLDRLEDTMLARAINFGNGQIPTLPFERGVHAMYYNKDIFDKFGIDYPTDDMTWDEVIELARQLSKEEDGVQYRGLDLDVPNMAFSQLNTPYADPETGDPLYTKEEAFVKYYDMLYKVWSIPGNLYGEDPAALIHSFGGRFLNDRNIAMLPLWNMTEALAEAESETGMKWDMVTYPVWAEYPDRDPVAQGTVIGVSRATKHPDDAFRVIEVILSDEWQTMRSKEGKPSVLKNPDVHAVFSSDTPELADKNLQAFFKHKPAEGSKKYHELEHLVENTSWDMQNEFARLSRDTITHLREVQEMAEERVRTERGNK